MSSLLDKLFTLINARVRGPHQTSKPTAEGGEQATVPSTPAKIPEVTEGRPRRSTLEVSETAAGPGEAARQPPAKPQPPAPPRSGGELDGGRVADMLKKKRE